MNSSGSQPLASRVLSLLLDAASPVGSFPSSCLKTTMNLLIDWTLWNSILPDQGANCDPVDHDTSSRASISERGVWSFGFLVLALVAWLGVGTGISSAHAQNTSLPPTMTVGPYTVDANGVKYYPVTSVYQGS